MKTIKYTYSKIFLYVGLIFITAIGCERDLSDEAEFATYPTTPDIFIDGFVGGLDYFPFGGSFAEAFSVDMDEKYLGSASMRFDIPQFGVSYGGATFPSLGPRNLSGYDALTFWAKASQGADINEIGFGINGDTNNKYQVTMQNMPLSTVWTKYVIAIPDPSKLNQEKGMFWYAEGAENVNDEGGYTFWIDELRFEKLGNIGQPQPRILNGVDQVQQSFVDTEIVLGGLTQTFNLASGENQTLSIAPSYFTFTSSNTDVAIVNELGVVSIIAEGTASITAQLAGVLADGSLEITSGGGLDPSPTPTQLASNVVSIFSDAYTNIPVEFYNGDFQNQGTTGGVANLGSGNVLLYNDFDQAFGFVTTQFTNPTVDLSGQDTIHFDLYIEEAIDTGDALTVELVNAGPDDTIEVFVDNGGGLTIPSNQLSSGTWLSFDLPLSSFSNPTGGGNFTGGLANRMNMGALTFASGGTLSSIIVDNIYFYSN